MSGQKIDIQHKIIHGTGVVPTIPSPSTITPDDSRWVDDTDILIGELALNVDDNKWYFRTKSNTIEEFQSGGGGGVSNHELLTNRDSSNQHPISAITDLQNELNARALSISLNDYQNKNQKGVADGYAGLDENSKIPLVNIPDISGNGKIAISSTDTLQDFLVNKIQAGSNITISVINSGSNESLLISSTGGEGGSLVWGSITGALSNQADLLTALNSKINNSEKGIANGVATLGIDSVIPLSQIPASLIGGLNLQGAWNAVTNTPTLTSSVGVEGHLYVVTVGSNSINLNGITSVKSGDSVFFDGAVWQKISGQSVTVSSVFGRIGDVVAQTGDYNTNQITQSTDRKFVTNAEKIKIGNLPTNTTTELLGKAAKIAMPATTKLLKSDSEGNPVESNLLESAIVTTQQINVSDIQIGESKLLVTTKQADGTAAFTGAVNTLDKLVSSVWDTLLADTAAWVGDVIDLTGNNLNGGLGQNGQEHQINGNFYLCISHVTGTTTSNGSARWVRNRSNDCLTTNAQDTAIVTLLQTESGWDAVTNTKIITTRSKVGSWYTTSTGYLYFCFAESGSTWYWRRIGQPSSSPMQITDATLIAEIIAHDFTTTPYFSPVATVKGEQGQEYCWITSGTTPNMARCGLFGSTLYWFKIK